MTYPKPEDLMLDSSSFRIPFRWADHPEDSIPAPNPQHCVICVLDVRATQDVPKGQSTGPLDFVISRFEPSITGLSSFQRELDTQLSAVWGAAPAAGPWDIHIEKQCYVAVILNPAVNWRFVPGSPGVTTKAFYGADNFGVTYVTGNPAAGFRHSTPVRHRGVPPLDKTASIGSMCKALYFQVARRRPDTVPPQPGFASKQGFNFHIEFFGTDSSGKAWTLPTIFDPNVPDGGGATIP